MENKNLNISLLLRKHQKMHQLASLRGLKQQMNLERRMEEELNGKCKFLILFPKYIIRNIQFKTQKSAFELITELKFEHELNWSVFEIS